MNRRTEIYLLGVYHDVLGTGHKLLPAVTGGPLAIASAGHWQWLYEKYTFTTDIVIVLRLDISFSRGQLVVMII